MDKAAGRSVLPPIRKDLVAGIDVGGTKIHITDTVSTGVCRYSTGDYGSMDEVLEEYFQTRQARPQRITVGMAGPRNDETGEITLTNTEWPAFNPKRAAVKYGVGFSTANDMVATATGVLCDTDIDLLLLKPGRVATTGTRLIVALSTGIGVAGAVWEARSRRFVIVPGEGGHIGFQPKTDSEHYYVKYLHERYPHASAELALSGKHGIDNLVNYALAAHKTQKLAPSIELARRGGRPVGAVLLEYARQGEGADKQAAQTILGNMGSMLGSFLRDLAVTYKATGGLYLTGSVALALGEYFAACTEMNERFVCRGAVHDTLLEDMPISLVTDPNVAAVGALALAKDAARGAGATHR